MGKDSLLYRFGPYRLLPQQRRLLRDNEAIALTPKAFDTLVLLVQRSGRLVEKEELLRQLWPEANVEESNVAQNVFSLRRALGQTERGEKYIETVSKRGYRFLAEVQTFEDRGEELLVRPNIPRERTLAILPLTFLGTGDKAEGEFLGVAFADSFITRLGSVGNLAVRPTASVMHYAGANALEAGRALGVEAVLDGKIQKFGERLRITLQLIEVAGGELLWGQAFDGTTGDVFRLEDAISVQLASTLVPQLTREERKKVQAHGTENPEAYAAYWRGRYFWNQFVPDLYVKAIEAFETAVALDPLFARAHVGLADCYNWGSIFGILPTTVCIEHATAAARRALELDDSLSDAYSALAFVTAFYAWDWEEGERLLVKALELNASDPLAHEWYSGVLVGLGRVDEWQPHIARALELNPLSLRTKVMAAWHAYHGHRFDDAIAMARQLLELNGEFPQAYMQLGNALEQAGDPAGAVAALERALVLHPDSGIALYQLCFALAGAGRVDEARQILRKLQERSSVQGMKSYFTAMAHVALGEHDLALTEFERAVEERDPWMFWTIREPKLAVLSGNARFRELQDRVVSPQFRGSRGA
jgi:DNA-binding winged helix-turn-helix (wHTH) protein